MSGSLVTVLCRATLGVFLLAGTMGMPGPPRAEHNHDGTGGSNNTNYEQVETHNFLNRRYDFSQRAALRNPMGGIQACLRNCPRDARLYRALRMVSGHCLSGHRWSNCLLAPQLT